MTLHLDLLRITRMSISPRCTGLGIDFVWFIWRKAKGEIPSQNTNSGRIIDFFFLLLLLLQLLHSEES